MILGDQDRLRTSYFNRSRSSSSCRRYGRNKAFVRREVNAKEASLSRLAVNVNETSVLSYDAVSSGESHSRALSASLCCEKRLQDVLSRLPVHPHYSLRN